MVNRKDTESTGSSQTTPPPPLAPPDHAALFVTVHNALQSNSVMRTSVILSDNSSALKGDGLLHNVVSTIVIGQWSRFGKLLDGNLIPRHDMTNVFHQNDALEKMVDRFSFKSQWVLDLSGTADGKYFIILNSCVTWVFTIFIVFAL